MLDKATTILRKTFGFQEFRSLQSRFIQPAMAGHDVLGVLPTGGGKSLCFQVPAIGSPGLALVVSPLIALMQDQVGRLQQLDVRAQMLAGSISSAERIQILTQASSGGLRMLYLSPERLHSVVDALLDRRAVVSMIAVDEAHCVVEWGHDFRPAYRQIHHARIKLGRPPLLALTASATPAVRSGIKTSLGMAPNTSEVIGSFDRPNLRFEVIAVQGKADRLAKLVRLVRITRAVVIVYAPTRGLVEGLTRVLRNSGVDASPYHAGMQAHERKAVLDGFLGDQIRVVVATNAFGMGIDKPDVRLVVHWSIPSTPEAYYQEAGRAGRDGARSSCVLYFHPRDPEFPKRQLDWTFPDERVVERLWHHPEERARSPEAVVDTADRLAEELHPENGAVAWQPVRLRRRHAENRLRAMIDYAQTRRCRRAKLLGWFGEAVKRCSGCDNCS